ncbi:MAG: hypothetical protein Q6373_000055 [Candidatus Sigynarchaeota archaeon]
MIETSGDFCSLSLFLSLSLSLFLTPRPASSVTHFYNKWMGR